MIDSFFSFLEVSVHLPNPSPFPHSQHLKQVTLVWKSPSGIREYAREAWDSNLEILVEIFLDFSE